MKTQSLDAKQREHVGSRESRRLRRSGRIPASLYGHGQEPHSIHVDQHRFEELLRKHARVLSLQFDGGEETAVIHEVQNDPITEKVVHIDFMRVDLTEKIDVAVALKLVGPAEGQKEGGVVQEIHNRVMVRCLATEIPNEILVDIRPLKVHESVHIRDLVLPPGVETIDDPSRVLVTVTVPRVAAVEAVAPAEGAPAEPELITKGKEAKGEEGAEGGEAAAAAPKKS